MAEWIYFIHAPREDFAATMTQEEDRVWAEHFERLKRLLAQGTLILAGPTLGQINTGLAIIEAPDEVTARRIMEADPTIARGPATGELRGFKVALLRGRDWRSRSGLLLGEQFLHRRHADPGRIQGRQSRVRILEAEDDRRLAASRGRAEVVHLS